MTHRLYGLPTHRGLVTPAEGIKPDTWYVAVASFAENNPLHACLVYSGLGAGGQRWGNYALAVNSGWDDQLLLGQGNDPYYLELVRDLGQLPMSLSGGRQTLGYANPDHVARVRAGKLEGFTVSRTCEPDERHTLPIYDAAGAIPPSGLVIAGWQARIPGKHWENHDANNLRDLQAAGLEIRPVYAREEQEPRHSRPRTAAEALDMLLAWTENEERLARILPDNEAEPHRNRGANYRLVLDLVVPALVAREGEEEVE